MSTARYIPKFGLCVTRKTPTAPIMMGTTQTAIGRRLPSVIKPPSEQSAREVAGILLGRSIAQTNPWSAQYSEVSWLPANFHRRRFEPRRITGNSEVNCCYQAITLIENWVAPASVNECNGDISPIRHGHDAEERFRKRCTG